MVLHILSCEKISRPHLTPVENVVLRRLRKRPGTVVSFRGFKVCRSSSLRVVVARLRKKLPDGETIERVRGEGYRLETGGPRHDLAAQIAAFGADSLLPDWKP